MRINTNVASLNAQESATNTNKVLSSSLEKLSSGLAINKASDNAAGMAIADKLRTQASSLGQSVANGNSASALIQIADKAMSEQSNILDIIKTKLLQTATATTSTAGQEAISKDIAKLMEQLDNIATQTNYNGIQLLQEGNAAGGSAASALTFQMGERALDTIESSAGVQANLLGLSLDTMKTNLTTATTAESIHGNTREINASNARSLLVKIDDSITKLNGWRSDFGSTQNQVESAVRNLATAQTNIKAAESVIRDVDYAQESAYFNKQNIISQAGTYAMGQANQLQQGVMRLLQ